MASAWCPERVARETQRALAGVTMADDRYEIGMVVADGDGLIVKFRVREDPQVFAVRFSVDASHRGVSTGESCSTPEQWASEVRMLLDEEVGTHQIDSARRTRLPDGVVLLEL